VLRYELEALSEGCRIVAGVDEAGRGPLAGPVTAAAVVMDLSLLQGNAAELFEGLTDSKQLSEARRESYLSLLQDTDGIHIGIGTASPAEIDQINILQATHAAMRRALSALDVAPDRILVDGRPVPNLSAPSHAIVKGDALSLSIAAASVVAKVTRDREMCEMDTKYPVYGFARHKGYGTREHLAALAEHGPCPLHRRSFAPVRDIEQPKLL
jgi:ribonuclease HII